MRTVADAPRIRQFMRELGRVARRPARVYITGGASAVLAGWRASTIDVDLKLVPVDDQLLRALPALKASLQINIELASPDDFIPVPEGWEGRSRFLAQEGPLTFLDYDMTSQALAKIERGHAQDLADVRTMMERGLVRSDGLRSAFAAIAPVLYRCPAIDPASFQGALDEFLREIDGA